MLKLNLIAKLLFLVVFSLVLCSCFLEEDNTIEIESVNVSNCLDSHILKEEITIVADLQSYNFEEEKMTIDVDANKVIVNHLNAIYNCCIDEIKTEIDVNELTISLYESEIANSPCYCICAYNIFIVLDDLESNKEYIIRLYHGDGHLVGEETVYIN